MPGLIDVIWGFGSFLEAAYIAWLVEVIEHAPGKDLMGIALMPDVEDELVMAEVENPVKGQGELDVSEV